jgi:hypothetical protein
MNATRPGFAIAGALFAGLALAGARVAIVDESALAQIWAPDPTQTHFVAGYPSTAADQGADVCVTIGFEVGDKGLTSDFTELKSWTSAHPDGVLAAEEVAPYTQIAAAVVSRTRYVPVGKAHAVFTSSTFVFDGNNPLGMEAIRAHCQIEDLQDFVEQLQAQSRKKGDLDSEALHRRLDIEQGRR